MLAACRLASLSAFEAHYADANGRVQMLDTPSAMTPRDFERCHPAASGAGARASSAIFGSARRLHALARSYRLSRLHKEQHGR
jgi:hypothetical protein